MRTGSILHSNEMMKNKFARKTEKIRKQYAENPLITSYNTFGFLILAGSESGSEKTMGSTTPPSKDVKPI
jgi:hypothetical protein